MELAGIMIAAAQATLATPPTLPSDPPQEPIDKSNYTLFDPTPRAALRAFTTDRPDITESPITVDAGHVQIEASLIGHAIDRVGGAITRTLDALPINLKFGLTNAIDVQFVFTPFQRVSTRDGATRTTARGVADETQVRLKVNLSGNDPLGDGGSTTAFAVMPFVKVPTGPAAIGNGQIEGGLILPLAVALPAGFSLGTMAEFDLTYDTDRRDYGVDFVHSATLGHAIVGPLAGYIEYVGVAPRPGGGGYRVAASSGVTYAFGPAWNIDAGGTVGLSGLTDNLTLFAGTSVRF